MAVPKRKIEPTFTYADYVTWPDHQRWELIDGRAYDMTPGPGRTHQQILVTLIRKFGDFFEGKPCEVYAAPFDVRLPEGEESDAETETVVQPDLMVICDTKKLDERGCKGPPDFIIEILSPGTASKDLIEKRELYEKHGVKEYWLVHPTDKTLMVFVAGAKGRFGHPKFFAKDHIVSPHLFPGLKIELAKVFPTAEKEP